MLLPTPTTVKSPRPTASKIKKVLLSLTTYLRSPTTKSSASPVTTRYDTFSIQNGGSPSIRSRIVPPPTAVTKPTT